MTLVPASSGTSRAPSGAASGDLSGTYPGPTVAKVNGVTVTGTPSTGYVPTATGAAAATWQAAASGATEVSLNLSAAAILGIIAAPVALVSAVPGKIIWPTVGLMAYHYVTTAYTDPGGAFHFQWGTPTPPDNYDVWLGVAGAGGGGFLTATSDQVRPIFPQSVQPASVPGGLGGAADLKGLALSLTYDNAPGPTLGAGNIDLIFQYVLLTPP